MMIGGTLDCAILSSSDCDKGGVALSDGATGGVSGGGVGSNWRRKIQVFDPDI